MQEGYAIRINSSGQGEIIKVQSLDVPSHLGKIWVNGDVIYLSFPTISNIEISGRPPLQIVEHMITFPADESGMTAAEAILHLRQRMMDKGNEGLLVAFGERGTDISAIMELYKKILS
jgi:hypothetical protein